MAWEDPSTGAAALLNTSSSPDAGGRAVATSLAVFVLLYVTLGIVDFVLMRRYARLDPPMAGEGGGLGAEAGVSQAASPVRAGGA